MAGLNCLRSSRRLFHLNFQGARICVPVQNLAIKTGNVPQKPKRPNGSSYMVFFNMIRPEILKENPGMKVTESGRLAGQRWKLLSEEEKEKYKPTEEGMDEYKTALMKWKESLSDEHIALLKEKEDRKKRLRFKKRVQMLGKPPKPTMNGFLYYVKSKPIERGDAPITLYVRGLAQQWSKMAVDDKEPFEAEAKRVKTEYFHKLDAWEKEMIAAGNYDVVRKVSLPANIDRKTLKPKVPKRRAKKATPKAKKRAKAGKRKTKTGSKSKTVTSKKAKTKTVEAGRAVDEDVSWMRAE